LVFPADHPQYPNQPKGKKVVLTKCSLYRSFRGKCNGRCETDKLDCCNKHILQLQTDFIELKSLVQDTIEGAGHLCLFYSKFHSESKFFIEFFWAAVKRHFRENCDSYFGKHAKSEHRFLCPQFIVGNTVCIDVEACRSGLGTSAAQLQVK